MNVWMGMHWLDRLSPRIQAHLERYARQWWFKSIVEARRRPGQDLEMLQGASDGVALRARLEEWYSTYYAKHARAQMDGRMTQHVSTAALCLATYHVLSPYGLDRGVVFTSLDPSRSSLVARPPVGQIYPEGEAARHHPGTKWREWERHPLSRAGDVVLADLPELADAAAASAAR